MKTIVDMAVCENVQGHMQMHELREKEGGRRRERRESSSMITCIHMYLYTDQ